MVERWGGGGVVWLVCGCDGVVWFNLLWCACCVVLWCCVCVCVCVCCAVMLCVYGVLCCGVVYCVVEWRLHGNVSPRPALVHLR